MVSGNQLTVSGISLTHMINAPALLLISWKWLCVAAILLLFAKRVLNFSTIPRTVWLDLPEENKSSACCREEFLISMESLQQEVFKSKDRISILVMCTGVGNICNQLSSILAMIPCSVECRFPWNTVNRWGKLLVLSCRCMVYAWTTVLYQVHVLNFCSTEFRVQLYSKRKAK